MKRTRTVIERHTIIDKRGNEKPASERWIDDNYLLYGKCQFFKHDYFEAMATFKYVETTYRKEEGRHLGTLWQAKTFLELTQLREAEEKLDYVRNQGDFPKNSKWELEAVTADFYLQTKLRKSINTFGASCRVSEETTQRFVGFLSLLNSIRLKANSNRLLICIQEL